MLRAVTAWIERAHAYGFIGEPAAKALEHSRAFAVVLNDLGVKRWLDLGSGGGVPGLVVATELPATTGVLLEVKERRASFLEEAVHALGLDERITVVMARAEVAGHDVGLRERFDAVVARSFAAPAVTAELGAAFVAPGGHLVVSEPPGDGGRRWDHPNELRQLGLGPGQVRGEGRHFVLLGKELATPERFPRRVGVPERRPLF